MSRGVRGNQRAGHRRPHVIPSPPGPAPAGWASIRGATPQSYTSPPRRDLLQAIVGTASSLGTERERRASASSTRLERQHRASAPSVRSSASVEPRRRTPASSFHIGVEGEATSSGRRRSPASPRPRGAGKRPPRPHTRYASEAGPTVVGDEVQPHRGFEAGKNGRQRPARLAPASTRPTQPGRSRNKADEQRDVPRDVLP